MTESPVETDACRHCDGGGCRTCNGTGRVRVWRPESSEAR